MLEDRLAPAVYTWDNAANTLLIHLESNQSLTVSESGGLVAFALGSGTFTQSGGDTAAGSGTNIITLAAGDLASSLTIDNSLAASGTTNVSFSGSGSLSTRTLTVSLVDPDAVGNIAFTDGFDAAVSTGGLFLTTLRSVSIDVGSVLTTGDGDLVLTGNAAATATGNFNGVVMNGSLVSNGAGNIVLTGGGGDGSGASRQRGVFVFGGQIHSNGTGTIHLTGVGGDGTNNNVGISLEEGAEITSAAGAISLHGTGGQGSENANLGVALLSGARIAAGGNATVHVTGVGGDGTDQNAGVAILNAAVTAVDGDILIEGTAPDSTGSDQYGIWIFGAATLTSTGSANLTLAADSLNLAAPAGIAAGTNTVTLRTWTAGWNIQVGSADSAAALGISNAELNRISAGTIVIGADGSAAYPGALAGSITVMSSIQHAGDSNLVLVSPRSVAVAVGAGIQTNNGDLTLLGNAAGTATGNFNGVVMNGSLVSNGAGNIVLTGGGGDGSGTDRQRGVFVFGGQIHSNGTGTIHLTGVGGDGGTNNNVGISLEDGAEITSAAGAISLHGTGGQGSENANLGVALLSGARIAAGGNATVHVTGVGGDGTDQNLGIVLVGAGVGISAVDGGITLDGTATDGSGSSHHGVWIFGSATLTTTGAAGLTVAGSSVPAAGFGIVLDAALSLTGPSNTLAADSMSLSGSAALNAGSNTVVLKPRSEDGSIGIHLGGADSAAALGLTDAELDRITAGTLVIGSGQAGPITVSAAISRPAPSHVQLIAGNGITISGGPIHTAGGNLLLSPGPAPAAVAPTRAGTDADADLVSFASDLAISINGAAVDAEYDQLNVAGSVDLTGVDLVLSGAYVPDVAEAFTIVAATHVQGTFNDLAPGATFLFNGQLMQITYGSSSVVLTAVEVPAITSASSATFTAGTAGSFTITATGFPVVDITLSSGTLPAGVTLTDNGDGTATLAGTPAAGSGGLYHLQITARNGVAPDAQQAFILTVEEAPAITSASSTAFTVGTAGSFTFTTSAFPAVTSIALAGTLPSGVSFQYISGTTATLAGTPTPGSSGVYHFTVTARNGVAPDAVQHFTLIVHAVNVSAQVRVLWPASYTRVAANQFRGVFTITNLGTQPLLNVRLSWPALPNGVTVVSSTTVARLAPGKSATVVVVFQNLFAYSLGSLKFYFKPVVAAG